MTQSVLVALFLAAGCALLLFGHHEHDTAGAWCIAGAVLEAILGG